MTTPITAPIDVNDETRVRTGELFAAHLDGINRSADRMFAVLMLVQWVGGILAALLVSPRTWAGSIPQVHIHVWSAIVCGGLLSSLPIYLALRHTGRTITRYVIAVAQMLWSALLIHLTGGRIETHFHVFGSLAFLAFYRDWRVLVPATIVIAADHLVRSIFWPQSVFGVLSAAPWRALEHAGWVIFEDIILVYSCLRSMAELREIASQRAHLERTNEIVAKKVEQRTAALKKSLAFEEATLGAAADGIVMIDYAGIVTRFNGAAERIFGYEAAEVVGQNVCMLMPSPMREEHDSYLWAYKETGVTRIIGNRRETIGQRRDGTDFPIEINIARVEQDGDLFFTGIIRDITARKEYENAIQEGYALAQLSASVNAVLAESGQPRQTLQCCAEVAQQSLNAAFFRIWTLNAEEQVLELQASAGLYTHIDGDHARVPVGKFKIGLIAEEKKPHLTNDVQNDPRVGDREWARREGMEAFAGHPLIVDGEVVGVMAMFSRTVLSESSLDALASMADSVAVGIKRFRSDETLARLNREMIDASRQAGMAEIATGVLHNIGNVLTGVNTSAQKASERVKGSKVAGLAKAAQIVTEHSNDLAGFITKDERGRNLPAYLARLAEHLAEEQANVLKELESLSAGVEHISNIVAMQQTYAKASTVCEEIDVSELLDQVLQLHSGTFETRGIEIVREVDDAPSLMMDKHKLLQILVNLVRNASHALADSGKSDKRLILRVTPDKADFVRIDVIDNGVGIEPANMAKIFGHGFTTKKDGHGFGLHSSALAAEEMGGKLSVHSEGPGLGATFSLVLPIQGATNGPRHKGCRSEGVEAVIQVASRSNGDGSEIERE